MEVRFFPGALSRDGGMVYAHALRACEIFSLVGSTPSLGTKRFKKRSVAQLVERRVWDAEVPGSNPGTPTRYNKGTRG